MLLGEMLLSGQDMAYEVTALLTCLNCIALAFTSSAQAILLSYSDRHAILSALISINQLRFRVSSQWCSS